MNISTMFLLLRNSSDCCLFAFASLPHMSIHTRIVTFSGLFFTDFMQISRILPYKIIYYFSASGQLPNVHNMLHNKAYDRDATPAGSSYQDRFPACFDELDHITV